VQCLVALAREGGAAVERGQREVAEHVGDAGQHCRMGEADLEDRVLVDKIGEPVGPGLLMYL
jgi:hypothetical protein